MFVQRCVEVFAQRAEEKSLYLHPERNQNDVPSTETDPVAGIQTWLSLGQHQREDLLGI